MKKDKKNREKIKMPGIKKPKFIVFTDKDGTINLEDKSLSDTLKLITKMGGMVVPITGRTVGDIKEDFKKRKIMLPPIIIGDNGAVVYSTITNTVILKKTLEHEKVTKIVDAFINMGGRLELIRYTDGENIYASKEQTTKKYYESKKTAKLYSNIKDKIINSEDITKITLAESKEKMEQIAKYAETLGFWTDMDETKFPEKEQRNYRLDIAPKNISKGEAVKAIAHSLKPAYGYICIGNGYNDISMFRQAINDGMVAGIMEDSDPELIQQMKEYTQSGKGRTIIVPDDKNKANRWIYRVAKITQSHMNGNKFLGKKQKRKKESGFRKDLKVKVQPIISNRQPNNVRVPKTNKEIEK